MSITRNIKPLLARLAKAKPVAEYSALDDFNEVIEFTKKEYDNAKKLLGFDDEIEGIISDYSSEYIGGESLLLIPEDMVDTVRSYLNNPVTVYELSGANGDAKLTADEYEKMGQKKVYTFSVHGYQAVLSADTLAIGCQEYDLNNWENRIEDIAIRYFGNYGSENPVSELIERQFREALPVLTKLQAKLKPVAKKKKTKAKKAKTGR